MSISPLVRSILTMALIAGLTATTGGAAIADSGQEYELSYTAGHGAYQRTSPAYDARTGSALAEGSIITAACWTAGETITNPWGYSSDIWVQDSSGIFWPEAWLETGSNGVPEGLDACGTIIPAAEPAQASSDVSCFGDYCSGQDPAATGCAADAITVFSIETDTGGGKLDLRWSPTCKTNWARWQQYPTGWCLNCSPLALQAVQDTGYVQTLSWFDNGTTPEEGETYWTPMIYSPVHKVYAMVQMPCGDASLIGAAFDCALNGQIKTPAG